MLKNINNYYQELSEPEDLASTHNASHPYSDLRILSKHQQQLTKPLETRLSLHPAKVYKTESINNAFTNPGGKAARTIKLRPPTTPPQKATLSFGSSADRQGSLKRSSFSCQPRTGCRKKKRIKTAFLLDRTDTSSRKTQLDRAPQEITHKGNSLKVRQKPTTRLVVSVTHVISRQNSLACHTTPSRHRRLMNPKQTTLAV